MPNPRNRIKATGDTHLPDVGDEGAGDEEALRFEPAQDAGRDEGGAPSTPPSAHGAGRDYVEALREQVRQRPVAALAGAFVLGMLLARG
jgi:hypothetical protein